MDSTTTYNQYQTILTKEVLETLTKEESDKLFEYLNSVEFISRLVSKDRKYARDLSRDSENKIIVDICNPHILEDMDYFREMALFFKKNDCYTFLRPNGNPNSEFGQLIKREVNRILCGMVRPSDGEWIPGELYFYWNYCPISLAKTKVGSKQADRVTDFPEVWEGTYLWAHYLQQARYGGLYDKNSGGKQAVIIARRGCGKSYYLASNLARLFIVGDNATAMTKVTGVITAYEKGFLTSDGTLNKFINMIDFVSENCTFFPSARNKDSTMEMNWMMGYKDAETGVVKGTKNEVIGFSSKDNPDKGRGKRAAKFIFEEFGNFPQFLNTWNTTLPSVKEGEYSYGIMVAVGTGGTKDSDFSGALEMIYHPEGYDVYALPNVFDRATKGKNTSVFFWGAYLNRKGYYNSNGVSDIIGALISEIKDRTRVKYNSSDPMTLTQKIAELAMTIQEAVMKRDGTIYPVGDLNERISQIDNDPRFKDSLYSGELTLKDTVIFNPSADVSPIWDFPHKDNKKEGCVIIAELPVKGVDGKPVTNRYISSIDPFDDDSSETLSLGAMYILDLFTDNLVAEYVGRPMFAEDFYENCRKLLLFYNARCNYENNKKGLFKHFSQYNSVYLLTETLDFLKEKQLMKEGLYGNKACGTIATEPIKTYGRRCIRDWLLKPKEITKIETAKDGTLEEVNTTIRQLYTIPFKPLLQELSLWNSDGNFDRHDALLFLMLLREDRLRLMGPDGMKDTSKNKIDDLANDPFFEKNYRVRE